MSKDSISTFAADKAAQSLGHRDLSQFTDKYRRRDRKLKKKPRKMRRR